MPTPDTYKRIKIAGLISFIPFVLVSAPLGGYFLASFLIQKFKLGVWIISVGIGIGLIAAIREVIKIIRSVIDIDAKS